MKKIYIGNLSYNANVEDLKRLFSGYKIVNINLIKDHNTGRPKGFGFIEFNTQEEVKKALKLDGQNFLDRPLRINIATQRR